MPYYINRSKSFLSVWLNNYPQGTVFKKFWFIILLIIYLNTHTSFFLWKKVCVFYTQLCLIYLRAYWFVLSNYICWNSAHNSQLDVPRSFYAFTTKRMHYISFRLYWWSEFNISHGMKHLFSINEIFSKELLQRKHLLVLCSHLISDHRLIIKNVSTFWTCSRPLQVSTYRSSFPEPLSSHDILCINHYMLDPPCCMVLTTFLVSSC